MKTNNTLRLAIPVLLLLLLSGCLSGTRLSSRSVADLDTSRGTYNLILYGGHNTHALRTIAILDRSDDPYTIVPYGASFNYRIKENLSAAEARESGEQLLRTLVAYRATEEREILGPDNTVIGYELRPLFMPITTGIHSDILDTSYFLQADNRVMVYVDFRGHYQDPMDYGGGDLLLSN